MRFNPASIVLVLCLAVLCLLVLAVPFATSGAGTWWALDWVDGRKLFSIDDAYRYFAARHAFRIESVFLWNYILPVALSFDAFVASVTNGNLPAMRLAHAGIGAATLIVIARACIRAGCGTYLATASVLVVGLMPLFLVLSSSFYAEGLAAFLVALAFLFLITDKRTALAITVSLLPLVRPEGAIYSLLFVAWFAMRRDVGRSALVLLPGLVYVFALAFLSADGASPVTWRIELRAVLAPLDDGISQALSPARLPNLLWAALALAPLFMARWRRWWPVLAAPWCIVVLQLVAITLGLQGFELRYLFTTVPVFGIAWALPVRSLLDRYRKSAAGRALVTATTMLAMLFFVGTHARQSDWLADGVGGEWSSSLPASQGIGRRTPAFDSRPLRAFASRTDALIRENAPLHTVFVASWPPLYFLDFPSDRPDMDVVLIPHNATVAAYSGGYFFGFGLRDLEHRYYRFTPGTPAEAPAVLIVSDSGQDPFSFPAAAPATLEARPSGPSIPATATVQSGRFKTYAVNFSVHDTVTWRISAPGGQ